MTRDRRPSRRSLPEEIRFFGRSTLFGIGIAIVYWFVSYEVAGTVLLLAFGIGSGVATAFLARQLIKAEGRPAGPPWKWLNLPSEADEGPFGDPVGRVPVGSLAPLLGGLGLTLMILGTIYGPPLIVVGLFPAAWGAWEWIRAASAEWRAAARADGELGRRS
jgi:hypothetical protein